MSILDELAAHARERVLADSENMSLDILQAMCREKGRANGARFYDALKKDDLSFICEVKKASPSKGVIARDFPYRHALRPPVGSKANAFFQRCFSIVEIWLITGTPHCDLFGSVRFKIQINIFVADSKAQEVQHPRPTADARHNF